MLATKASRYQLMCGLLSTSETVSIVECAASSSEIAARCTTLSTAVTPAAWVAGASMPSTKSSPSAGSLEIPSLALSRVMSLSIRTKVDSSPCFLKSHSGLEQLRCSSSDGASGGNVWSRIDIAWLAGLFEGEGCITTAGGNTFVLRLAMTDFDVVKRAFDIAGVGRLYPKPPGRPGNKQQLLWVVADEAHAVAVLAAMWPFLGDRRKARAEEAIQHFRKRPRRQLTQYQRDLVVEDWRRTGASQWELARRHGISRSRVQQLLAEARRAS